MRRHGPGREMLRKVRLQHLTLLRCDHRAPTDHLVHRPRPAGERQFLRRDDVGLVTADTPFVHHVEAGAGRQLLRGDMTRREKYKNAAEHCPWHNWNPWNPWNPWNLDHFTSIRTESY